VVYATWNITGITFREEPDEILRTKNIKMAVITETKKKLKERQKTKS
jgi:hypothetical protein